MYATYETSGRRSATRRTWLAAGGALAAVLVLLILIAAACNARSKQDDPLAGAIDSSPTPTATAPDPVGSGMGGSTDTGQTDTGEAPSGNDDPGSGGDQPSGDGGDDGEEEDDGEEGEEVPWVIDITAKANATVTPAQHHAINCQPTNITVHGTIALTGGLWLPADQGDPPTKVTVEYRWILDGSPGLSQTVHFTSPGEKDVSTTMGLTGNATVAIEILSPNQSTSADADIHVFC